jgi:transposase InsO family protein
MLRAVPTRQGKVHKHASTSVTPFAPPERRFGHIHVDLVGPLPPSNGFRYILTVVDRFTRWPEAWPLDNMSAYAVAQLLMANWISRFGVPDTITTDQGRQFESDLFQVLLSSFGIQHARTSPYHPQSNGMVERFHRTLKAALTAHESPHWSTKLPVVLLALRNTVKPDIGQTPAELVYGTTLRLPGEYFHPAPPEPRPPELVAVLRDAMGKLRYSPGTNHDTRRTTFVSTDLSRVSHVFIRVDAVKPPLQP